MATKPTGKVTIDEKEWQKIKKEFIDNSEKIKNSYVTIGIHEDAGDQQQAPKGMGKKRAKKYIEVMRAFGASGTISLAQLAAVHEYGADIENGWGKGIHIHIPERSFLRAWIDENKEEIEVFLEKVVKKLMKGEISIDQALGFIGEYAVGGVKRRMIAGLKPGLAASTIKKRRWGGTKPLIDTGQLLGAISYRKIEG